jgi:hypothetical protein
MTFPDNERMICSCVGIPFLVLCRTQQPTAYRSDVKGMGPPHIGVLFHAPRKQQTCLQANGDLLE